MSEIAVLEELSDDYGGGELVAAESQDQGKITEVFGPPFRCEVVEDMPRDEYDEQRGLNPTTFCKRSKSALAAKHQYETGFPSTDAMAFGRCCHSLLFESSTFQECWSVWDGGRRYGSKWDAFLEEATAEGKEVIRWDGKLGLESALHCVHHALRKPKVRELIAEGSSEVSVFTEECGLQGKGRIDRIDTRFAKSHNFMNIVDAKFTNTVEPFLFGRSAASFLYHVRLATYKNWLERETGVPVKDVFMIAVETAPPYDVCVMPLAEIHLDVGWSIAQRLIGQVRQDIDSGQFHGVDGGDDLVALDLPDRALEEPDEVEWGQ